MPAVCTMTASWIGPTAVCGQRIVLKVVHSHSRDCSVHRRPCRCHLGLQIAYAVMLTVSCCICRRREEAASLQARHCRAA